MRYERLELDLSTPACDRLFGILTAVQKPLCAELTNLHNELRARLQRRDPDPKCPKNEREIVVDPFDTPDGNHKPTEDWLNT